MCAWNLNDCDICVSSIYSRTLCQAPATIGEGLGKRPKHGPPRVKHLRQFYKINVELWKEYLEHYYQFSGSPNSGILFSYFEKSPLVNFFTSLSTTGTTGSLWRRVLISWSTAGRGRVVCTAINSLNCRMNWRVPYHGTPNRKGSNTLILLQVEPQKSYREMEQVLTPHQHMSNYDIRFLQCWFIFNI